MNASNAASDPWDEVKLDPVQSKNIYDRNPKKDAWDELEAQESWGKDLLRTLYQIPSGLAQAVTYPLDLVNLLATGSAYDPEGIEDFRRAAERSNLPFDEERYLQGVQRASELFPTQSNIERMVEEKTGAPLTPKTRLQKGVKFASTVTGLAPKPGTFRGMETALPRPVLGVGTELAKEGLQELGLPEPLAELGSFAVLKSLPPGSPEVSIGKTLKPSGLPKRGFESLTKPREVSPGKFAQINQKLEQDFKGIANTIIKESPIGETQKALIENPLYKQETRELLNEAQVIADNISKPVPSKSVKTAIADMATKQKKGYLASEYDKTYDRFIKEMADEIPEGNLRAGSLVEQYRKNNQQLSEYFEPGASKAFNRGKRDALLDHNRAITAVMEKFYPETELVPVFKQGNDRWKKIMDSEAVDEFISDFTSGKINFKKGQKIFEDPNTERIFKRALGDQYPRFETLMKDMLSSEQAYKMLEVAKANGWRDLFSTGASYVIHPNLAKAKELFNVGKKTFKFALNSLLDKPTLTLTWKNAIENLKQGNFQKAQQGFARLKGEIETPIKTPEAPKVGETIEVTPQPIRRPTAQEMKLPGVERKRIEHKPR